MLEWIVVALLALATAVYLVWRRMPRPPLDIFFGRCPRFSVVFAAAFGLVVLASSLSTLYRALGDGVICRPSHFCMTFNAHPFRFVHEMSVAVFGVLIVTLIALAGVIAAWDGRRRDNRAKNAPPLDNAVRRRIDER